MKGGEVASIPEWLERFDDVGPHDLPRLGVVFLSLSRYIVPSVASLQGREEMGTYHVDIEQERLVFDPSVGKDTVPIP